MKNIYKAIADFQQEVPVILKDTSGFGYKYADLPKIFEVINPLMKKHGLGFFQAVTSASNEHRDVPVLETIVFHIESGEKIQSVTMIPQGVQLKGMNDFQVLGSAITYIRRYALSSMLGLVTDKDTDASGEQVRNEKPETKSSYLMAVESLKTCMTKESRTEMLAKMLKSTKLTSVEKVQLQDVKDELDAGDLMVVNID